MNNSTVARLVLAGMMWVGANVAGAQAMHPGMMGQGGPGQGPQARGGFEQRLGLPGMAGRWWANPRVAEYLKVTDADQKALDGILLEHREKLIDLRASLEKVELKMQELVASDNLDEAAISAQIDKIAMARGDLEKANAHYLLAVWSKLTPEQRSLVKQFRGQAHAGQGDERKWGQGGERQRFAQPGQRFGQPGRHFGQQADQAAPGAVPPPPPQAAPTVESK